MKTIDRTDSDIDTAKNVAPDMKTILVLTDCSASASDAADYAAGLAGQINASRMILYYSDYIPAAVDIPLQNAVEAEHDRQKNMGELNALKEQLKTRVHQTRIEISIDERPLDVIVNDTGKERSVDLVIMGMTGKSRLEQALMGSNTINVARAIKIPLLIVPQGAKFHKIERILLACDLKEAQRSLPIGAIKNFAGTIQPRLFVLNVDREEGPELSFDPRAGENRLKAELGIENTTYHRIRHHNTADGLALFAAENKVQLIIAVPKEYGFFDGLFHRSLTQRLAYHTHIPLLLFKGRGP
jgi:nucleotide-binding universal stress UspA family protein